jgi:hypothetical protein
MTQDSVKRWHQEHPERIKEIRAKNYEKHGERYRQTAREKRRTDREKVLAYFGNRCACCGETTYEFLTIDHIQGGGRAQLKGENRKNLTTFLCRKYPDGNFPRDKYQCLCWNCNCAKGHYGICPHQRTNNG